MLTVDSAPPVLTTTASLGYRSDTLSGTASDAGTSVAGVEIIDVAPDGTVTDLGAATLSGTTWSFRTADLADGHHKLEAVATDRTGNTVTKVADEFNLDRTAPTITSSQSFYGPTRTTQITLSGTAADASGIGAVKVFESHNGGSRDLGSAQYSNGNWSMTITGLEPAHYRFYVVGYDSAGNSTQLLATGGDTVVEAATPAAPVVTNTTDQHDQVTFNGHAEPNTIVIVNDTVDGTVTEVGLVTSDGNGNWTVTTDHLADGTHDLSVLATADGNDSVVTEIGSRTIDTVAPAIPTLTIEPATLTNAATSVLSGRTEAGATVTLTDGNAVVGMATADADGNWSVTTSRLADGSHEFKVSATEAAGNRSDPVSTGTFTVDTKAPGKPTILSEPAQITANASPTLSGTAEAGSSLTLVENGTVLATVTTASNGTWSATVANLSDGPHHVVALATDAAGNVSAPTAPIDFTVDTVAPGAPAILTTPAALTNSAVQILSGTAEAGSSVALIEGGQVLGAAMADGDGNWSITVAILSNGMHHLTALATDAAGNGSASTAIGFTVDTIAPDAPSAPSAGTDADGTTANIQPTLSGTAETGALVTVEDRSAQGGVTVIGSTRAGADGQWTLTSQELSLGEHNLFAVALDAAGNVSTASAETKLTVVKTTQTQTQTQTQTPTVDPTPAPTVYPIETTDPTTNIDPVVTVSPIVVVGPTVNVDPVTTPTASSQPTIKTIDPAPAPFIASNPDATATVFRFFDRATGTQFLTNSLREEADLRASNPNLTYEGPGLRSVTPDASDANVALISRFFDTSTGSHFFTSSAAETADLKMTRPDLVQENSNFYGHVTAAAGDVAVYRFFNSNNGTHFYTSEATEQASIVAKRPDMVAEGIAFYSPGH